MLIHTKRNIINNSSIIKTNYQVAITSEGSILITHNLLKFLRKSRELKDFLKKCTQGTM